MSEELENLYTTVLSTMKLRASALPGRRGEAGAKRSGLCVAGLCAAGASAASVCAGGMVAAQRNQEGGKRTKAWNYERNRSGFWFLGWVALTLQRP